MKAIINRWLMQERENPNILNASREKTYRGWKWPDGTEHPTNLSKSSLMRWEVTMMKKFNNPAARQEEE